MTLSGAGPSVLLIVSETVDLAGVINRIRLSAADPALEVLETGLSVGTTANCAD